MTTNNNATQPNSNERKSWRNTKNLDFEFALSLVGIPYALWTGGPLTDGSPMWSTIDLNANVPDMSSINGASCAGFVNLVFRKSGVPLPVGDDGSIGGTYAYGTSKCFVRKPFQSNVTYANGTLLGRYYRNQSDQGHIAIVYNGYCLQSIPEFGINCKFTIGESNRMPDGGDYYEYVIIL